MQTVIIVMLGLGGCAYASTRSRDKSKPSRLRGPKGWQKVLGVLALMVPLLILFNPELLALGLLGDTAVFEMLVLALGLQLHTLVAGLLRRGVTALFGGARRLGIPSPGLCYLLAVLGTVLGGAVTLWQKAAQRLLA